jgi:CelD/BcsL family acetyltransferase involved in cellulose biosynthesis
MHNTSEPRFVLLQNIDEVESIRADWERLWICARAAYFLSFPFVRASLEIIHRPQGATLCCAVAFENDRLVAVLPMVLRRRKLWKAATPCTPRAAEGCDILIARSANSVDIAAALLREFVKLARPDFLEFDFVKFGSHLDGAIRNMESVRTFQTETVTISYADLKAELDWPSYKRSLGKSHQSEVARKTRRLQEQGKVTVDLVQGKSTTAIDWLFEQKRKWSERTNKRGNWVFSGTYCELLNKLLASDPRYLMFVLKLDNQPISAKLIAINPSSASAIIAAYDERFGRFSPGNILDEFIHKYLFDNCRDPEGRYLDIDFGPGREPFKLHWSRGNVQATSNYRIATSPWGLARFQLHGALDRVRRLPPGQALLLSTLHFERVDGECRW